MIKLLSFCLFISVALAAGIENRNVVLTRLASSRYYISSDAVSFVQAWAFCENYGMKFLSINNKIENTKLIQNFEDLGISQLDSFWIGGIYIRSGLVSKWYWVNGDNFIYTNWNTNTVLTPDNCVRWQYSSAAVNNGKWYASNCANKFKFICKS